MLRPMTPRLADIAFVLEGVPGVAAVYAFERHDRSKGDFEIAVRLEYGKGTLAAAHYALLRVLTHEECGAVFFCERELPPLLRERASRLQLSAREREEARARVPESSTALEQAPHLELPPFPTGAPRTRGDGAGPPFRTLIVDGDVGVQAAVREAFGPNADYVIDPNSVTAFWKARHETFDLILCDARLAFGREGFLSELRAIAPLVARKVMLIADEGERELVMSSLDQLKCWTSFVCRPIDAETLREIFFTGSVVQRWTIPVLPPRQFGVLDAAATHGSKRPGVRVRRALVVDDDPTTAMLLASMHDESVVCVVTSDEWEAVDAVEAPDLMVVACSAALRTKGGTPFYRLLWNARPEIKERFVFIASPDAVPASAVSSRAANVIERPVTREVLKALVARFDRSPNE
jgi:CheY-like chemotaxis protein